MGICAIVVCVSGLKSENLSIVCKMFSFTERRKGLSKSPTSGNARGSQLLDLSTRVLRRRGRTGNKMSKLSIFNMSTFRAHLCDKQHPPELTKPVTSMNNRRKVKCKQKSNKITFACAFHGYLHNDCSVHTAGWIMSSVVMSASAQNTAWALVSADGGWGWRRDINSDVTSRRSSVPG